MKQYIVFDSKGEILRTGFCQALAVLLQARAGEMVIEGLADDLTEFVDVYNYYQVAKKLALPVECSKFSLIADGVDEVQVTNIPNPGVVTVDGARFEVTDGAFEFSVDLPGEYEVVVEAFPYLPAKFEVIAV